MTGTGGATAQSGGRNNCCFNMQHQSPCIKPPAFLLHTGKQCCGLG